MFYLLLKFCSVLYRQVWRRNKKSKSEEPYAVLNNADITVQQAQWEYILLSSLGGDTHKPLKVPLSFAGRLWAVVWQLIHVTANSFCLLGWARKVPLCSCVDVNWSRWNVGTYSSYLLPLQWTRELNLNLPRPRSWPCLQGIFHWMPFHKV